MSNSNGLTAGALRGLIRPYCTIDRIQPKIDDDNIVIVFFCGNSNQDAAYDLSSFIEKGAWNDVLDTEVSDVPNGDSEYEVFVEVPRDIKFYDEFIKQIKDINKLSDLEMNDWTFTPYGHEEDFPLDDKSIRLIKMNTILGEGSVIELGRDQYIVQEYNFSNENVHDTALSIQLEQRLGEEFSVGVLDDGKIIVEHNNKFHTLDKIL